MITDSKGITGGELVHTDICVVGSGVAGLAFATEFARQQKCDVVILESGGVEPSSKTQDLNVGDNIGLPYYELERARIRALGGTGYRWHVKLDQGDFGVRLRGLDEIDFKQRDWVPFSGWPFGKSYLDSYYERAHTFCNIGRYSYNAEDWKEKEEEYTFPFDDNIVGSTVFHFGRKKEIIDEHINRLAELNHVRVLLHSTVQRIDTDANAERVTALSVLAVDGKEFTVKAKHYVLASGGLEVPRLLLLSNHVAPNGLGNDRDLVGRFFMEHPHLWSGVIVPKEKNLVKQLGMYSIRRVRGTHVMAKLRLGEEYVRKHRLLNYSVSLHPGAIADSPKVLRELKKIASSLGRGKAPKRALLSGFLAILKQDPACLPKHLGRKVRSGFDRSYRRRIQEPEFLLLNHMSEQSPNRDSRVILDKKKDFLGQRRVKLDWRLSEIDIRTMHSAQQAIREQLNKAGIGELTIEMDPKRIPPGLHGGWHHMGTTRMHENPEYGVVDPDCKVHGMANLHVAGASVFPTVGYANPVLTTVALAIRLADHLKTKISRPSVAVGKGAEPNLRPSKP